MTSDVYDSDDAMNRSPLLQPQVIKYGPEEELPPFLHKESASGEGGGDSPSSQGSSTGRSRKKRRQQPTLGDAVLIRALDPNRPDIARIAAEDPLVVDSSDDDDDDRRTAPAKPPHHKPSASQTTSEAADLGQAAARALSLLIDDPPAAGGKPAPLDHGPLPSIDQLTSEPKSPRPSHRQQPTAEKAEEDSLATSPLGKFTIYPSNHSPQDLLPAIQSPPRPTARGSPENTQSLPSIHSAIGEIPAAPRRDSSGRINPIPPLSISGASPPLPVLGRERQLSGPPPPPAPAQMPSPFSHVSAMSSKDPTGLSPASQSSYSVRPAQGLRPDLANMTSPYDTSPRGPQSVPNPAANYPTPTDPRPGGEERPALASGPSPPSGPMYKCKHPGCTAPPFQTQYLLK